MWFVLLTWFVWVGRVGIGWEIVLWAREGVTTSAGAGEGDPDGAGEALRDEDAPPCTG